MVASGLAGMVLTVVAMLSFFSSRSFVAVTNYVSMDQQSQLALDKMSREIREVHRLTAYTPSSLTFEDADSNPLQYVYDSDSRLLMRISGGLTNTLLTDCDSLQFSIYQQNVISNSFDAYDPSRVTDAKLIQVNWNCSRQILGAKVNTESVQSAKITIRNPLVP